MIPIPIIVRARAYNDLYQHQGCVKTSIKWDPILMLVLTAPESGSKVSRFDAGFNRAHFEGQNGPYENQHQIRSILDPDSGAVKTSIKWGPHLMLFLTHPGCWYRSLYARAYNDRIVSSGRNVLDLTCDLCAIWCADLTYHL